MRNRVVVIASLWILLAAAVSAKNQPSPADNAPTREAVDSSYRIGPQDVLDIRVWKEPELSVNAPVRIDGQISLPLIRDLNASGLTPEQLATEITVRLRKYVADPNVTVIVTAMNSQRVYVLGQVARPGPMPLLPEMDVLQALASAGGLNPFANAKKVYILRVSHGSPVRLQFNYNDALKGKDTVPLALKPGDTIVVP